MVPFYKMSIVDKFIETEKGDQWWPRSDWRKADGE